jgi:hypothetical protein
VIVLYFPTIDLTFSNAAFSEISGNLCVYIAQYLQFQLHLCVNSISISFGTFNIGIK